jgi:hypothetical protein
MIGFKIGCMLFVRMVWNVLCFDFISVQLYALLLFIHLFCERVEEEDQDE